MRVKALTMTLVVAAALLCSGCDPAASRRAGAVMADVNPFGWSSAAEVRFANSDTLALTDLSLVLRRTSDSRACGLPLEITLTAPDGSRLCDSVLFSLPRAASTASTASVATLHYRRGMRFGCEGVYTIVIRPLRTVRGVEAAGFTFDNN